MENIKEIIATDGEAYYFPDFLSGEEAAFYFKALFDSIYWEHDKVFLFGKEHTTKRRVGWYGDKPFEYSYSNRKKQALIWNEPLIKLKNKVEFFLHETFNSCLLNFYHNGKEGMGWHADNEPELKENGSIASVSLGAERKFCFRHNDTRQKKEIILQNGSLVLMKGSIQNHWKHCLPKTKKIKKSRINLTWRTIVE